MLKELHTDSVLRIRCPRSEAPSLGDLTELACSCDCGEPNAVLRVIAIRREANKALVDFKVIKGQLKVETRPGVWVLNG